MNKRSIALLLLAAPPALLYASLFIGRFDVSPVEVARILGAHIFPIVPSWSKSAETIVLQIRLPRALMAMCVGAGLSISGAAYQGMFRNPLVSTDILGVTAASGFGAALALLLSRNAFELQLIAFASGLAGVALTYRLARIYQTTPVLMLVLSGVVVGAFFSASLSAIKYLADPESKLPAITYWLLGSLNAASIKGLIVVLPPIVAGSLGLLLVRWKLNVLTMGDEEARTLGIETEWLKGFIIVCTTLITAAAVSVCGMVGWIGLVIPHVGRMLVGPDHRALLPATLSIGACYLLIVDDIARTASPGEIPLGILTAIIGAPFFAYLLRRTRGTWH
ncbi:MAG TPA: iron ABC transporter permease [Steroidobacteraceae bacterium]|nr:iron ABC transporter permease [Steroidobacteraceae bacterium]